MSIESEAELLSLLIYLQEEFQDFPDVRIRFRQPAVTMRSVDLVQDYDPKTHDLHRLRGIQVKAGSREYFFPVELATSRKRSEVDGVVRVIKESLGRY